MYIFPFFFFLFALLFAWTLLILIFKLLVFLDDNLLFMEHVSLCNNICNNPMIYTVCFKYIFSFFLFELVLLLLLSLLQHWIFAQASTTCHGYQKTLCCIGDNHPHWNTTTFLWGRWNIISIFSPTFGCNCNNNLIQLVNVILHNFPSTSNVVALRFDLGYWVKLQSTTLFFVFYACQIWWWVMDFEFQDVKGHFVWHDQQAKAISCKETHQVSTCDPCGGSSGLCDLQIVPWLKHVDVQWIVCHQQINYYIGYMQSC